MTGSTPTILGIGTSVPGQILNQSDFRERILRRPHGVKEARYLERILKDSGIRRRHTILRLNNEGAVVHGDEVFENATTGERNALFSREVLPLALEATEKGLVESRLEPSAITHLIAVTCTGFTNPGFDAHLIRHLPLSPHVHRYTLGFMGCYAALPSLELAATIARDDSTARVLVLCAELCSLHFQPNASYDDLLSSTLFADGVAAVVVGQAPDPQLPTVRIVDAFSSILFEGEEEMAWSIGDTGFLLTLSPYVSRIIGQHINRLLPQAWISGDKIPEHWLVHPGGKSILDRVQESVGLNDTAIEDARTTLAEFGNMSSATVLFALSRLMHRGAMKQHERAIMLGFGPGLTVKAMLLEMR